MDAGNLLSCCHLVPVLFLHDAPDWMTILQTLSSPMVLCPTVHSKPNHDQPKNFPPLSLGAHDGYQTKSTDRL